MNAFCTFRHFTGMCNHNVSASEILSESRFANDAALSAIYKSLAPGGSLGLIWNIEDCWFNTTHSRVGLLILLKTMLPSLGRQPQTGRAK